MARIGLRPLAQLCRRVGTSLRAGLDARSVWDREAHRGSRTHQARLSQIASRVSRGDSVAEAMRDAQGYFPLMTCELADVGERTGRLDEAFLRLADHYDHLLRLRRAFVAGIAWPAIQLAAAITIVGLLIWILGVLPLRQPVRIFGLAGESGLAIYAAVVTLLAAALAVAIAALTRGWLGPAPMAAAMRLPWIGGCLRTNALARLAWSLAMALEAGIDARRSLQLAMRSTQNAYFTAHIAQAEKVIAQGGEFHEALRRTGAFPDEFLDALEAAEQSGTESESMTRLSEEYQDRAQAAQRVLTIFVGFAVWAVVIAILIALIVNLFLAMVWPYYREVYDVLDEIS